MTPLLRAGLVAAVVFAWMAVEARRAAANERALRARGGVEPPGDVYRLMQVAYPLAFLLMAAESASRADAPWAAAGALVFALSKALKWWAIVSLGDRWTFRVIVMPGAPLVTRGPYRALRHPNYVAVVGELVGAWLMTGARVMGPSCTATFALLIWRRLVVEERALARAREP